MTEAQLFDDKFLAVSVAHIAVGKENPPHSHDDREQVYYIVRGKGKLTLGDGQYDVSEGTVVHIPLNTLHGMRNLGDEPLVYIYFVAWAGELPL